MSNHPNAIAATISGAGIGGVLVWLLGEFASLNMPDPVATTIGGLLAGLVLLIGRKGFRGLARIVWRGSEG